MAQLANQPQLSTDEHFMALALDTAKAGLGWTSPNPLVGCVLVKAGKVIGVGAHLRDGAEHAEARALAAAGDARGATAYVNLEPCTHFGRQPACCSALIAAGVSRVVYGVEDFNQRSTGKAQPLLEDAGIAVASGVLGDRCQRFLDYYLHAAKAQGVFVQLKLALSLDAKMACETGHSQWLSGPHSLGYAHYLRQKYDAVLVGSGTIEADNPRLTARPEAMAQYYKLPETTPERNPVRVILDKGFGLDQAAGWHFLKPSRENYNQSLPQVVIAGSNQHLPPTGVAAGAAAITHLGLEENHAGRLDLGELLDKLWLLGIRSLLVEGGSRVSQEFISQGQVNKLSLVYTPKILGRDAKGFAPPMELATVGEAVALHNMQSTQLGADVLVEGYLRAPGEPPQVKFSLK